MTVAEAPARGVGVRMRSRSRSQENSLCMIDALRSGSMIVDGVLTERVSGVNDGKCDDVD
jgi:hypothetical protein